MYIKKLQSNQLGFTLIEIMVGLVIGLIGTLVIMQTFSLFEGQKRTTTGNSDAQVNASIAIYNIQRKVQSAGYGLPIFDATVTKNSNPLRCVPLAIDHDTNNATAKVDLFPIAITDTGAGNPDQITVRYFPGSQGGLAVNVQSVIGTKLIVDNNLGCTNDDLALVVKGISCLTGKVTTSDADLATYTTVIDLVGPDVASMTTGTNVTDFARLTCVGPNNNMNTTTFSIGGNQLQNNGNPVIADIVDLQAQYGIAAANSNDITGWVNANSSPWNAPSASDRNRIRAIRVAVLARNGLLEKTDVTTALPATWVPLNGSVAPSFSVSGADWKRYRYRAYETIIPLRNLAWNKEWM
jgi:type IV pilus assembly protein PilW